MSLFRFIAGVIALITAAGGYMSWKYSTTSTCQAAATAIQQEMPRILDDLADRDPRFKALKVGGALFSGLETFTAGAAAQLAQEETQDKTAVECGVLVVQREFDSAGFRKTVGDEMAEKLRAQLPF